MPGGVVQEIPHVTKRAILRIAPNLNWASIEWHATIYQLERDHGPQKQSPGATRTALDGIIRQAAELRRDLLLLKEESADAIGDWSLIDATASQLYRLISASKAGANEISPVGGRPESLRQGLVRSIAGALRDAGCTVDARPNGVTVPIVSELLKAYGDEPSDVPALVRSALRENHAKP